VETQPDQKVPPTGGAGSLNARVEMPRDLCLWAAPADVVAWVREELAAMVDAEKLPPAQSVLAEPMLPILAYAYARGIFDSEEIAQLLHSDAQLRELSKNAPISAPELKAFRHRDRGLLVKLLVQLLIKATRQQFGLSAAAFPPALRRQAQENAVERLDSARHIDRGDEV